MEIQKLFFRKLLLMKHSKQIQKKIYFSAKNLHYKAFYPAIVSQSNLNENFKLLSISEKKECNLLQLSFILKNKKREFSSNSAKDLNQSSQTDDSEKTKAIKNSETVDPINDPKKLEKIRSRLKRKEFSLERNFITPIRAMSDFLLNSSDLDGLRKTVRRSPHADEPPIVVLWRKDVENKAREVWGSLEELSYEKLRRSRLEVAEYQEAVFNVKKILKKYRRQNDSSDGGDNNGTFTELLSGSGRVVVTAVVINASNFVIKLVAWFITGSHSMFAEAVHSLADTINQIILAYGIHKSTQRANVDHPYGYTNMRNVASLISGVGIFAIGAGLSFYHGITGLCHAEPIESLYWAFFILGGSLISEGATLYMAVNSVRSRAQEIKISFKDFVLRGRDPSLNVVLLEDAAAVSGVVIAAMCMGLTSYLGTPIYDAVGSLLIGGLLGGVASFIIYSNSAALVGRSIPRESLDLINGELEKDAMIRAIHDVKGIDMGNMIVRYKAEVDFDGRELTKAYIEKQDLAKMFEEIKGLKDAEEFESFMLRHGENIVDTLGAEIDRIENRLKKEYPEIRHCDLEIL